MPATKNQKPETTNAPLRVAADFGPAGPLAQPAVRAFHAALLAARPGPAAQCLDRWKSLLAVVGSGDLAQPELLLAGQTYYALVVKLLTARLTAATPIFPSLPALAQVQSDAQLRDALQHWESTQALSPSAADAGPDLFGWYTSAWTADLAHSVRRVAECIQRYTPGPCHGDVLQALYQQLFSRRVRHGLGEYYTPAWLAEHVLDEAGYDGDPGQRLLDPACGSGVFLVAAIHRALARRNASSGSRDELPNIVGFDLNPLAVLTARANYLIALGSNAKHVRRGEIPVFLRDTILDPAAVEGPAAGTFDLVVGNPPWIAWDRLSAGYRRATLPLWRQYGLFSLSGNDARHGGGKKDLAMLLTYVAADRHLRTGGRLAFVITQTVFQTKGAGDGFRHFRLGVNGIPLRVIRVHDLTALRPFAEAAARTATLLLEKGTETRYPVPYLKWTVAPDGMPHTPCAAFESGTGPVPHTCAALKKRHRACAGYVDPFMSWQAEPVEPQRPSSPWRLVKAPIATELPAGSAGETASGLPPLHPLTASPSHPFIPSYQAHLGANSGGANGVYWLELLGTAPGGVRIRNLAQCGRDRPAAVTQVIEPDLLYPLLRWGDVGRYTARPAACVLLAQNPQTRRGRDAAVMQGDYPLSYAYLEQFRAALLRRAAYRRYQAGGPFYAMYNVGPYTVSPLKVVWRRMDRQIRAAVVAEHTFPELGAKPIVPQETCVLVAVDSMAEAHYLCAVLNSAAIGRQIAACSISGGKGFGTPGMLQYVQIGRYDPADRRHEELAQCSRAAHAAAAAGEDVARWQAAIDRVAEKL